MATGEGSRLLATAFVEKFTCTSSGALEATVEGSTKPVVTITHAGIITVDKYEGFAPPDPA